MYAIIAPAKNGDMTDQKRLTISEKKRASAVSLKIKIAPKMSIKYGIIDFIMRDLKNLFTQYTSNGYYTIIEGSSLQVCAISKDFQRFFKFF